MTSCNLITSTILHKIQRESREYYLRDFTRDFVEYMNKFVINVCKRIGQIWGESKEVTALIVHSTLETMLPGVVTEMRNYWRLIDSVAIEKQNLFDLCRIRYHKRIFRLEISPVSVQKVVGRECILPIEDLYFSYVSVALNYMIRQLIQECCKLVLVGKPLNAFILRETIEKNYPNIERP